MNSNTYNKLYNTGFCKKLKESPREALKEIDYNFSNTTKYTKFIIMTTLKDVIYLVILCYSYVKNINDLKSIQAGEHAEASTATSVGTFGTLSTDTSSFATIGALGSGCYCKKYTITLNKYII